MSKEPRPLAEMQRVAGRLVASLEPYCERVAVAGSVRREKALCADLEICAIPRMVGVGLFDDVRQMSALYAYLSGQLVNFLKGDSPTAKYHQLEMPDGLQVDLFLADLQNWGWIYLIRTGSADFSTAMLTRHKARQGIGKDQQGSVNGRLVTRHGDVIPTSEESDVFSAVGVAWVPPMQRHDGSVLRAVR